MLKQYKKTLILTSALTLLPLPVMLLLGREWSAILVTPLIMLAGQWLGMSFTLKDPGNQKQNPKPMKTVLWILPILSNVCCGIDYAFASGWNFSIAAVLMLFLGGMFAVIGNYLPKVKMNSTLGIKIPWAYTSAENWNATHRFGGRSWFLGGLAIMVGAFLPENWSFSVMLAGILVLTVLPVLYSYCYYRKQKARGDALIPFPPVMTGRGGKLSLIFLAVTLLIVGALMFTGDIDYHFEDDRFTAEADFYDDLELVYDVIESLEYREGNVPGTRIWGYGSFRLLLGNFQNEEFGSYTRYTYYDPQSTVVLTTMKKTYVFSGRNREETLALYQTLLERIG